ncbi:hypothetical protein LCGC14_1221650 [marine sediment metagenome]|uniref:Uncharacterized protein n=1 Tax=marine sediment metagenome TaxID=412755 RepID=A0A0F9LF25_9ZZZZ
MGEKQANIVSNAPYEQLDEISDEELKIED